MPYNISNNYHVEFIATLGIRGPGEGIIAIKDISLSKECFGIGKYQVYIIFRYKKKKISNCETMLCHVLKTCYFKNNIPLYCITDVPENETRKLPRDPIVLPVEDTFLIPSNQSHLSMFSFLQYKQLVKLTLFNRLSFWNM